MTEHTQWSGESPRYRPDDLVSVRWADVIGARNAVTELLNTLQDPRDPPSEHRTQSALNLLPTGVFADRRDHFDDPAELVSWLTGLRDRLREALPSPGELGEEP